MSSPTQSAGPPAETRYNDLDALRAAAILLVIVFHVVQAARGLPIDGGRTTELALLWFANTAHDFQMPVFFMMSGFFGALVVARAGGGEFMRGRLRRIGIPLVAGWILLGPVINLLRIYGQHVRGHDAMPIEVSTLFTERLHHLWFLWYLLMYCALFLVVRAVAARWPALESGARRAFGAVIGSRARLVVLVPLTAAVVWPADLWAVGVPPEWTPHLGPFVYFAAFFGFGWLLYGDRELLPSLRRGPLAYTLVALPASILAVAALESRGALGDTWAHALVVSLSALVTWTAILALLGWFHRWFDRPDPRVRYASEASYWLYLAHLPLVSLMSFGFVDLGLPFLLRIVLVPVLTVAILLVVYDRFVRYGAIGRLLHGQRERAAASKPVAIPG